MQSIANIVRHEYLSINTNVHTVWRTGRFKRTVEKILFCGMIIFFMSFMTYVIIFSLFLNYILNVKKRISNPNRSQWNKTS